MVGKGAIIAVFGFALAFSVYQLRISRAVISTTDNFNQYYIETLVHQTALSGMNFGINKVWKEDWTSGSFQLVSNSCSTLVTVNQIGTDTVKLKALAWKEVFDKDAIGTHDLVKEIRDSVVAYFSYSIPISRYFWFTNQEAGVYWITGDTVWGPIHTNGVLRTSGSPTFYGKVTAYRGIAPGPSTGGNRANFYGGWEVGVYNELPTDMSPLIDAANIGNGDAPVNTKSIYNQNTTFEFLPDGKVIRTVGSSAPDTVLLSEIAPNGVIYSTADIHVKGVLNGQVTIYSNDDIWIDDNIVYANDPNVDPNSDDLLGLIARDNIIVSENDPNNDDVVIQACLMAINGSFYAENYSGRPIAGTLTITGSIVQNRRGAIGTFERWSNSITHGFSKRYHFDPRLKNISPPHYPYVRELHLVSWWE